MGLFLGGFERGFLVYFFGFLVVFNIIDVMRGKFWGFLSGFRELLVAEIELDF